MITLYNNGLIDPPPLRDKTSDKGGTPSKLWAQWFARIRDALNASLATVNTAISTAVASVTWITLPGKPTQFPPTDHGVTANRLPYSTGGAAWGTSSVEHSTSTTTVKNALKVDSFTQLMSVAAGGVLKAAPTSGLVGIATPYTDYAPGYGPFLQKELIEADYTVPYGYGWAIVNPTVAPGVTVTVEGDMVAL